MRRRIRDNAEIKDDETVVRVRWGGWCLIYMDDGV